MSRDRVEKAYALLSQTLQNDLRVKDVNIRGVARVVSDAARLLEESLGMAEPARPRDALLPKDAPPEPVDLLFAGDSGAQSSEVAALGDLPEEEPTT